MGLSALDQSWINGYLEEVGQQSLGEGLMDGRDELVDGWWQVNDDMSSGVVVIVLMVVIVKERIAFGFQGVITQWVDVVEASSSPSLPGGDGSSCSLWLLYGDIVAYFLISYPSDTTYVPLPPSPTCTITLHSFIRGSKNTHSKYQQGYVLSLSLYLLVAF